MKLPNLIGMVGMQSDGKGIVTFQFKSADGRSHYVPLKIGVINAMMPTLVNIMQSLDNEGLSIDVQPMSLTSARAAYFEDGAPGLEIGLEGVMLRVTLDHPGAIPKLIALLTEFQNRAGESHARH